MQCEKCEATLLKSKVYNSRRIGETIYRQRKCNACGYGTTTYEISASDYLKLREAKRADLTYLTLRELDAARRVINELDTIITAKETSCKKALKSRSSVKAAMVQEALLRRARQQQ